MHTFSSMNEYTFMVISNIAHSHTNVTWKITIYHNLDIFTIIPIFINEPKYFATTYNFYVKLSVVMFILERVSFILKSQVY